MRALLSYVEGYNCDGLQVCLIGLLLYSLLILLMYRLPFKSSSNHSSVVIYSLVLRSFFDRFPFYNWKNDGNELGIYRIKNDVTVSSQRNISYALRSKDASICFPSSFVGLFPKVFPHVLPIGRMPHGSFPP